LPPSNFDNAVDLPASLKRKAKGKLDRESAMELVTALKTGPSTRRRRRKFIYGALYKTIFPGCKTIDLSDGSCTHVEIVVTLDNGETSVVRIGSAKDESAMLEAIVGLGRELPSGGNTRKTVGDVGDMFALGYRSSKTGVIYVATKDGKVPDAMARASTAVGKYMKEHWPADYADIREADNLKATTLPPLKEMGGKDGPGNVIMISRNLGNSGHFDSADASRSTAFWVEEEPGGAKNWWFIFPDVSIDGSKGVVIKLFHGIGISWDGSKIKHCSSITDTGDNNNVYGCMFGSCR
jgi:hypothetical protein